MYSLTKAFFRDIWISIPLSIGLFALGGIVGELARASYPSGDGVFLHYTVIAGVNVTGPAWKLYLIPLITGVVWGVDAYLAFRWHARDRVLSYVAAVTAALIGGGMWWATHLIIQFGGYGV